MPLSLRALCFLLYSNVEKKFGDFKFAALGGYFFLRFLCPAIVTPDSHGLVPSTVVTKETRRTLTLLTKGDRYVFICILFFFRILFGSVLQNVSNGVEFGAKEEFMLCMNSVIRRQIPVVKSFFSDLIGSCGPLRAADCEEKGPIVSGATVERSIDAIYKQILFQQKKLESKPAEYRALAPLISVIGVPEKLARSLNQQRQTIHIKQS